ncbi:MAG: DUF6476 family protein [Marinosulfonomonas sp.]
MNEIPTSQTEVKNLRFLRILVTTLTVTMIFGVLAIVALLVIRFTQEPQTIALPDEILLPDGATAYAFTRGPDWYAVVTSENLILIYDAQTNTLMKKISLND